MPQKAKLLTLAFCTSLVGGSAVAGNPANEHHKIVVALDRIQNTSTGDPGPIFQELQSPKIYLWVVLFRISGQDYHVDNQFNILGSPRIYPFQGGHNTVNGGHSISPGQIVTLYDPTSSNRGCTVNVDPIQTPLGPMPGAVGLVTAINIQKDTPNDSVEQGRQLFNLLVSQAVDKFVKNRFVAAKMSGDPSKLLAPLTSEKIAQLQSGIASQVSQEIKDNISIWKKIGYFFSGVFGSGAEDSSIGIGTKFWPLVNTNIPLYFDYDVRFSIRSAVNTSFQITGEFANLDAGGHSSNSGIPVQCTDSKIPLGFGADAPSSPFPNSKKTHLND